MDKLLLVVTSKKMTTLSVVLAVLLFLADSQTAMLLKQVMGITEGDAMRLTSFSKLAISILAAAGYSPLKRPNVEP